MPPAEKPAKPSADFPLFPHATGYWAKKIKGRMYYLGRWDDPSGALERYREHELAEASSKRAVPKSTKANAGRPAKPHKDFPLFPHANGQWAKKIAGKTHYFGPWNDPESALDTYLRQKDDLLAGRKPSASDAVTVRDLVNQFLAAKEAIVLSNELEQRTFDDYYKECKRVIRVFGRTRTVEGLAPDDFEELRGDMAESLGPVALGNAINRVRVLFKYAFDQRLIPTPVHFGQSFKRPSAKTLRKERQRKGKRLFEATQIQNLLTVASIPLKAMILLGINAGFGNSDCAHLSIDVLDFKTGWHGHHRKKTGVERRCKLWAETSQALQDVLAARRMPEKDIHSRLVFITRSGRSWGDDPSSITKEFDKLLKKLKIKRPGLAFYALRHTFQTVAEKCRDAAAVQAIMGHVAKSSDMSSVYREEVDDDRLQAVTDCVHGWLFGD